MNSEMTALSERIRICADRIGGGNSLAQKTAIPRRTLETYITGQSEPQVSRLVDIAKAAGVNVAWLATGSGSVTADGADGDSDFKKTSALETPAQDLTSAGFVFIPRLAVEASAGFGREVQAVHQVTETVAFQESWLRKIGVLPKNAHALTAIGDSMEPTIRDGDLLLVDSSIDRVRDNGIYVVVVSGMVFVKRLHIRMDGSLVLKSDNSMYPEEVIKADEAADLQVAGRVRWFGRTI